MKQIIILLSVALAVGVGVFVAMGGLQAEGEVLKDKLKGGQKIMTTQQDFHDKLATLRRKREDVQRGIKRIGNRKSETLELIRDKGINSAADIKADDKEAKYLLKALKEYSSQVTSFEKQVTSYDNAIASIQLMLKEIERKTIDKEVGLSEEDELELFKIVKDLDERLELDSNDPLEDDELGKLLDAELNAELENQVLDNK